MISYIFLHATENMVTQELAAHDDMQKIAASEALPRYHSSDIVSNMLLKHSAIMEDVAQDPLKVNLGNVTQYIDSVKSIKTFKTEIFICGFFLLLDNSFTFLMLL